MGIRIYAAAASLIILAAMVIALGIYFRVIPVPMSILGRCTRTTQAEISSRYDPPDTVANTLGDSDATGQTVDIGAKAQATLFDLDSLEMFPDGETGYRPGHVLHDQHPTIGANEYVLTTAVGLQDGRARTREEIVSNVRRRNTLPLTGRGYRT